MNKNKIAMIAGSISVLVFIILFITNSYGNTKSITKLNDVPKKKMSNNTYNVGDDKGSKDKKKTETMTESASPTVNNETTTPTIQQKVSPSNSQNNQSNANSGSGSYNRSISNEIHYGRGTFYGGGYTGGCAMLDGSINQDEYVCAMNPSDFNNARLAGACIELTGPKGTIKLLVTDLLPEGQKGDIDLNQKAFEKIANLKDGEVQVSWKIVQRNVSGPVVIRFKDGSTQYWMGVQIRNHKTPIEKVEILGSNGSYINIARKQYNFFEINNPGSGPFTFRITDIYGKSIIESNIPLKVPGDIKGVNQF